MAVACSLAIRGIVSADWKNLEIRQVDDSREPGLVLALVPKALLTTWVFVVTANGTEAGMVGIAGGSYYHGAVFVPRLSGVEHTSRETQLRGSWFCWWGGRC